MANTENIEAKLAAYVDDELDAAGRIEIEKHLAANPQHREMIAELREMRTDLRSLPHVNAPPEIAEMLGAQLERAALLGDVEIGSGSSATSFSRWPQVRAIAAIVFITVGLATALYYILPSPKPSQTHVALVLPEESPTAARMDKDASAMESAAKPAPTFTPAPMKMESQPVVVARMVIDTPDPAAANAQVKKYLEDNRISFEQAKEAQADQSGGFKSVTLHVPTTQEAVAAASNARDLAPADDKTVAKAPTTNESELKDSGAIVSNQPDAANQPVTSNQIVAKMTNSEAQQLCFALSQSQQSAQLTWPQKDQSEESRDKTKSDDRAFRKRATTAESDDADRPLLAGDTLRVRAHPAAAPDTDSIDETVTVDPDGFISLPTAGRIAAAGETPRKLADETIPQAMTGSKQTNQSIGAEMKWSIERTNTSGAMAGGQLSKDREAQLGAMRGAAIPTTGPSTQASDPSSTFASTRPAGNSLGAQVGPTEDRVDVVIVLRSVQPTPASVAPAITAPTTEPTTTEPATAEPNPPDLTPATNAALEPARIEPPPMEGAASPTTNPASQPTTAPASQPSNR